MVSAGTRRRPGPRQVSVRVVSPTPRRPRYRGACREVVLLRTRRHAFQKTLQAFSTPFDSALVSGHFLLRSLWRIRISGTSRRGAIPHAANPSHLLRGTSAKRHEIMGDTVSPSICHRPHPGMVRTPDRTNVSERVHKS